MSSVSIIQFRIFFIHAIVIHKPQDFVLVLILLVSESIPVPSVVRSSKFDPSCMSQIRVPEEFEFVSLVVHKNKPLQ